jgi:hypothetical protein
MGLKELYETYGQLIIQLEILQNKINECKQSIAQELNKPRVDPKPDLGEKE